MAERHMPQPQPNILEVDYWINLRGPHDIKVQAFRLLGQYEALNNEIEEIQDDLRSLRREFSAENSPDSRAFYRRLIRESRMQLIDKKSAAREVLYNLHRIHSRIYKSTETPDTVVANPTVQKNEFLAEGVQEEVE